MRKTLMLVMLAASLVACSKKSDTSTTTTTNTTATASATVATTATTAAPSASASAAAAPVDVSPEMKGFLAMLDGGDKSTSAALKKYGNASVQSNDLGMYKLKNPKVTKSEKLGALQCYTFESEAGIMKHETKTCWDSKGKIAQITDKSS